MAVVLLEVGTSKELLGCLEWLIPFFLEQVSSPECLLLLEGHV